MKLLGLAEKDFEIIIINLVNEVEEIKESILQYFKSQDWILRTQCISLTADFIQA